MPALLNRDTLDQTLAPLNTGQSYTGPWLPTNGFAQVACEWISVGGATLTVTVEESLDGTTADRSTSAGTAGANGPAAPVNVPVAAPFCRLKVAVSVANATTLRACMKATG
jgi:hypothetical protein